MDNALVAAQRLVEGCQLLGQRGEMAFRHGCSRMHAGCPGTGRRARRPRDGKAAASGHIRPRLNGIRPAARTEVRTGARTGPPAGAGAAREAVNRLPDRSAARGE
ncbi:hypothetical protein GCM10010315_52020 [Streptomyces luteosporeus]|uniref:Uncharacterized protein n=1 Tax=Streptomyces luteosporeus TaxID=173856 RepID=A0ABN3U3N5_9ACTN